MYEFTLDIFRFSDFPIPSSYTEIEKTGEFN